MRLKSIFSIFLLLLLTIVNVEGRYQISIPFFVDSGGSAVSEATVGINITESTTCRNSFYFNKTTVKFGRGVINVTSSRFIASRTYTLCFNATSGSNKVFGKTTFQPGVGDINVSRWVNGTNARFNVYQLNNGSNFDSLYGRGIINKTNDLLQFGRFNATTYMKALYGSFYKNITIGSSGIFGLNITGRYINISNNGIIKLNSVALSSWKHVNSTVRNNSNIGKIYINSTVFLNGTINARKYLLTNGSNFDALYGRLSGIQNNTLQGKIHLNSTLYNRFPLRILLKDDSATAFQLQDLTSNNIMLVDSALQKLIMNGTLEVVRPSAGASSAFVVGDKGVSKVIAGIQGKVAVTAKEALELKLKQIFALEKRLEAIDKLLADVV